MLILAVVEDGRCKYLIFSDSYVMNYRDSTSFSSNCCELLFCYPTDIDANLCVVWFR